MTDQGSGVLFDPRGLARNGADEIHDTVRADAATRGGGHSLPYKTMIDRDY